jgi:hypothetical protein
MSSFTRVGGYLGLVAFLGALAILALVPNPTCCTSDLRDRAAVGGLVGYVLILDRLGYLAVRGGGRSTRALSVVGIVALIVAGVGLYVGIRLTEQTS